MMPVRLCFENKKTLLFSYTQKKNYRNRFEFWFFHLILKVYTVCLHFIMQINITFWRFKENLA